MYYSRPADVGNRKKKFFGFRFFGHEFQNQIFALKETEKKIAFKEFKKNKRLKNNPSRKNLFCHPQNT